MVIIVFFTDCYLDNNVIFLITSDAKWNDIISTTRNSHGRHTIIFLSSMDRKTVQLLWYTWND